MPNNTADSVDLVADKRMYMLNTAVQRHEKYQFTTAPLVL